jgi:hypothetical protein
MTIGTKLEDWAGAFGHTTVRGENIVLTADIIELSKDRYGDSWLQDIDDLDAQKVRWSEGPYFARGPAPEGMSHWEPGTVEQVLELQARRQVLYDSVKDPDELAVKLRELQRSPLGQNVPTFSNRTVYDAEAPKNGAAQNWDVN